MRNQKSILLRRLEDVSIFSWALKSKLKSKNRLTEKNQARNILKSSWGILFLFECLCVLKMSLEFEINCKFKFWA